MEAALFVWCSWCERVPRAYACSRGRRRGKRVFCGR